VSDEIGAAAVVFVVGLGLIVGKLFRIGDVVRKNGFLPNEAESDVPESGLPLPILPGNVPMYVPIQHL
jgi:hypothetical protein